MIYFIANYEVEGTTKATILEAKKWLLNHKTRAIDCETPISDWIEEKTPIMYQFGDKWDQWVIDRRDTSIESFKSLLQDEKAINIVHNVLFDYQILKHHDNITLESIWDTMLGEQTLYKGLDQKKGFFTLEQTYERYFNFNPYGNQLSLFDPFITKKVRADISKKTTERLTLGDIYYGAMDIRTAYQIYELQKERLRKEKLIKAAKLKFDFALVLGDCELNGMPINQPEWLRLSEWSGSKLKEQESILQKLYPTIANWNSHVQVKKLFKEIGIPIKYQDKESVSELVIKEHENSFPIITEFLKYKKYQKLTSTYGVKFLENVSPYDGRIHSSFLQIPVTGRISSTHPNLQNLPQTKSDFLEAKWWREAFRTPNSFTIADYSSQEMRLAADISKDKELISIFKEGRDPHREAAAALYSKTLDEVTTEERKNAKTFNFAVLYGTGAYKLSKTFNTSVKEAQKLIDNYFGKYSSLKAFQDKTFKDAMNLGYIVTDSIGSKAYIPNWEYVKTLEKMQHLDPDYKKEYKKLSGEIFRTCCNYKIQSQAALIAKTAGILLRNHLKTHPNEFKILLLEHDCWITENFSKDAPKTVERCMREAAERYCSIEIPAEALVTSKWSK
jgi:DNA polymerase-1